MPACRWKLQLLKGEEQRPSIFAAVQCPAVFRRRRRAPSPSPSQTCACRSRRGGSRRRGWVGCWPTCSVGRAPYQPRHASASGQPCFAAAPWPLISPVPASPSCAIQIPASDIVGATTQGAELVIWHAPLQRRHWRGGAAATAAVEKPQRSLRRTPPLQLQSAEAAAAAATHLRRCCCWGGGNGSGGGASLRPPRLLVIVNPASGPGRCVP